MAPTAIARPVGGFILSPSATHRESGPGARVKVELPTGRTTLTRAPGPDWPVLDDGERMNPHPSPPKTLQLVAPFILEPEAMPEATKLFSHLVPARLTHQTPLAGNDLELNSIEATVYPDVDASGSGLCERSSPNEVVRL